MAIFFNTTNCHQNCFLPDFSVFTNVKSSKQILVTTRRTVAVVQWRTAAATHRGRTGVWLRLTVAAAYCGCDLLRRTVAVVQCGCGLLRLRHTVAVLQCGCGLLWLRRTVTVLQCGCSLLWLRRTVAVLQCGCGSVAAAYCGCDAQWPCCSVAAAFCGCGSLWLRGNPLQPPFIIVADFFKLTCERYSSIHNVHLIFSHLSVAIVQLPVGVQLSVL